MFDPAQFPEIVPTLIEALQNDRKPGVCAEAALSLGKIRPVTDRVGVALEQTLAKDSSMRLRLQARSVLLQYRWSGWKQPVVKKDETPTARPKDRRRLRARNHRWRPRRQGAAWRSRRIRVRRYQPRRRGWRQCPSKPHLCLFLRPSRCQRSRRRRPPRNKGRS